MNIPTSPNDMPSEWRNDAREIRNAVVTLAQFSCVDIHWERDHAASEATGENVGEWEVILESGRHRVRVLHPEINNALWFALQIIEAQEDAAYQAKQKERAAALSKLTPHEQKLLGISLP